MLADELELALQGDLVLPPFGAVRKQVARQTSSGYQQRRFSCIRCQWCEDWVNKKVRM